MARLYAIFVLLLAGPTLVGQLPTFHNVATSNPGDAGDDIQVAFISADGGFAWGDINQDGFLDLVVNTHDPNQGTRILVADASDPANPVFVDQTATLCENCATTVAERSALLADINHDGYIDLIVNTWHRIDVYLNRGPADGFQFGIGTANTPNRVITFSDFHDSQMNSEGLALIDFDGDNWLDLILENHDHGIDLFSNPRDGTANFQPRDPGALHLPTVADEGAYSAAADIDDDGDVDFVARKGLAADLIINNGNGTFTASQDFDDTENYQKGAVSLGDLDNDGDFDLYWSDHGTNQIWINQGGTFVPTATTTTNGEPWASAGLNAPTNAVRGVAMGDINNDGRLDLMMVGQSGAGWLFINQTPAGGPLDFTHNNCGINVNGNGVAPGFADYDNDGDLDLYVNVNFNKNQLWRNNLNNNNYLFVEPRYRTNSGTWRSALGANVLLRDCNGNLVGGIREVATGGGRGVDAPDQVHFGLPLGPDQVYEVEVHFVTAQGSRSMVRQYVKPSEIDGQTIVIYQNQEDIGSQCLDFDGDGITDRFDADDDNDGIGDWEEFYTGDHDGDGVIDHADPDYCAFAFGSSGWNCADGLPDPSGDLDADGTPNYQDPDFLVCSVTVNGRCLLQDRDLDGQPSHLDLDAENDGIPDLIEAGGIDTDGDGMVECTPQTGDIDTDGWCDLYDLRGGSVTNGADLGYIDSDGDGIANQFDLDSDNDLITDLIEAGGIDSDGDGRVDQFADEDRDGFADTYDPVDNDPLTRNDVTFAASNNTPLTYTTADANGNGLRDGAESYVGADTDGDNVLNAYDLDSDNDGIPDLIEVGGVDADGDGRAYLVPGLTPTDIRDLDWDGLVDFADPDNNLTEVDEDVNNNNFARTVPSGTGAVNGNPALPDYAGNVNYPNDQNVDVDRDGIPNYLDLDSDNDGLSDLVETFGAANDPDEDGRFTNTDSNHDGWYDGNFNTIPTTNDGSSSEFSSNLFPDFGIGAGQPDHDGDGYPNFLDIDSDNDGIVDLIEAQGSSTNLANLYDGLKVPGSVDSDYDGLADAVDNDHGGTYLIPVNTDGTDTPDFLDDDADNDGLPDYLEGHDANSDGVVDNSATGVDSDADGLDDGYDTQLASYDPTASNQALQDTDGDLGGGGDRDWRDFGGNSFPVEWLGIEAKWQGSDAVVRWGTANEWNSDRFVVQRSLDGQLFENIGVVAASGQSYEANQYEYTDLRVAELGIDRVYYRLQQLDVDGSYNFSSIVVLNTRDAAVGFLRAYPNPAQEWITAEVSWPGSDRAQLDLYNSEGKVMYQATIHPGTSSIVLDLKQFPGGLYILRLQSGFHQWTERIRVE